MRFPTSAALVLLLACPALAQAQTPTANADAANNAASGAKATLKPDAKLATVDGQPITERDLGIAYAGLSDSVKQEPQAQVLPQLLNELVNEKAIDIEARKEKLDRDPEVKASMQAAADQVLQNALLRRVILPQVGEDKIKAVYDSQYANQPGEMEVHAEHILLKSKPDAEAVIAQLNKGADFKALAKAKSTDPNASDGGDLGWFKRGDVVQAFSDAAFAMKPGDYSKTPVQSPYGWHVIKVLGTRVGAPKSLSDVHDAIASQLQQAALRAELVKLRNASKVVVYDQNGKPVPQTATTQ